MRGFVGRSATVSRPALARGPGRGALVRSLARLRVLVMVLVVPLALSWSLPALARVVAGPPAHVCHCATSATDHRHATCACPKCFPELAREDLAFSEESVRGQCGDDEAVLREARCLDAGVLDAPWVLAPAAIDVLPEPLVEAPPRSSERAPPLRPPKITARV